MTIYRGETSVQLFERQRARAEQEGARMVVEKCESCGKDFKRFVGRRKHHCPACKQQRLLDSIDQVSQRQGPHYDKWREAMIATADRLRLK